MLGNIQCLYRAQAEEEELKAKVAAVEDKAAAAGAYLERLTSAVSRQETQAAASTRFQRAQDWCTCSPRLWGAIHSFIHPSIHR